MVLTPTVPANVPAQPLTSAVPGQTAVWTAGMWIGFGLIVAGSLAAFHWFEKRGRR